MRELQQKQKIKRWLYSVPVLVAMLLLTVALGRGAYAIVVKERQSAKDAELLEQKVSTLIERETTLKAEIERLGTDAGVEEEIKAKYNVASPGEHVAVIVDRPGTATTTQETLSWYKRFWNAILGR